MKESSLHQHAWFVMAVVIELLSVWQYSSFLNGMLNSLFNLNQQYRSRIRLIYRLLTVLVA